ncbi:MAG: DUF6541 family protein [Bacteroidota bacterium]
MSFWERQPEWRQHAICIGFLVIVAAGFFSSTTFGGRTLVGGDTVRWAATAEAMLTYEKATGVRPEWSPNVFAGMPGTMILGGSRVPGVDTLVSGLRQMGLWPVAHFLVLLLGTYLLVFSLTRSKLAGTVSAVGFGLTTYLPIILTAGHNTKFIALAYAPWLLAAFAAVIRRSPETGRMASALLTLLFAIAAAVNLRAGHVQITYYLVVIAAVWWVAEGIAAVQAKRAATFLASTGLLVAGSLLALAMVADPYLLQAEYKAYTIRSAGPSGGLAWDYAMQWSQGFGEMLTLAIPNAYGGGGATYWGEKIFTEGPHYVGPVILLLAFVGVAGVARRSVVGLAAAGVLMTLFALGEYLPLLNRPAFELLPLFNAFRVPETWLVTVALVLAVLAGWGAYYIQRTEATEEADARKRRVVLTVGTVLTVVVGGLWLTGGGPLDFEKQGEAAQVAQALAQQNGLSPAEPQVRQAAAQYVSEAADERESLFAADAGRSLLILGLALALIVAHLWERIPGWVTVAGLALLVTVDLWGVGRRYFSEEESALQRRSAVTAQIQPSDADRFLTARVEEAGGAGRFRVLPANWIQNAQPSYFYESIGGYHGAKLTLIQDYFDRILPDDSLGLNPNATRLLAARYLLLPGVVSYAEPVFQDEQTGLVVSVDSSALPRAFFADSVAVVSDDDALIEEVRDPATDLLRTALVSDPGAVDIDALTGAAPDSGAVSVELGRFSPDEIVYEVSTDRPRLLVFSEVYYPAGWTATVGLEDAPILRTNYLLRGVPVRAGDHIVTLRYQPETRRQGVLVASLASLLAYLGVIGLGGLLWYRRGQSEG